MSEVEIYVLCKERSKKLGEKILDNFLPERKAVADDYPFPELVDEPEITYTNVFDLMDRLDLDTNEGYSLYWNNNTDKLPIQAMLFYTEDGYMIAGLVILETEKKEWLQKLANFVEGKFGYTAIEQVPPETSSEFISYCKNDNQLRLIEGKILS